MSPPPQKKFAMHCMLRSERNLYSSKVREDEQKVSDAPTQTFAVFWRNTEKSEAAMTLLRSGRTVVVLD